MSNDLELDGARAIRVALLSGSRAHFETRSLHHLRDLLPASLAKLKRLDELPPAI